MIRAAGLAQRLANIVAARGLVADFGRDVQCVDDSDGLPPRLAFWDPVKLGPEPTQEEVDAASDAPIIQTAAQIIDAAFPQTGTARVLFEALFEIANRLQALEGKQPITRLQLKTWLESKLP